MIRLYDYLMRHLHCCGCGCLIGVPLAAFTAIGGGVGTWVVLT